MSTTRQGTKRKWGTFTTLMDIIQGKANILDMFESAGNDNSEYATEASIANSNEQFARGDLAMTTQNGEIANIYQNRLGQNTNNPTLLDSQWLAIKGSTAGNILDWFSGIKVTVTAPNTTKVWYQNKLYYALQTTGSTNAPTGTNADNVYWAYIGDRSYLRSSDGTIIVIKTDLGYPEIPTINDAGSSFPTGSKILIRLTSDEVQTIDASVVGNVYPKDKVLLVHNSGSTILGTWYSDYTTALAAVTSGDHIYIYDNLTVNTWLNDQTTTNLYIHLQGNTITCTGLFVFNIFTLTNQNIYIVDNGTINHNRSGSGAISNISQINSLISAPYCNFITNSTSGFVCSADNNTLYFKSINSTASDYALSYSGSACTIVGEDLIRGGINVSGTGNVNIQIKNDIRQTHLSTTNPHFYINAASCTLSLKNVYNTSTTGGQVLIYIAADSTLYCHNIKAARISNIYVLQNLGTCYINSIENTSSGNGVNQVSGSLFINEDIIMGSNTTALTCAAGTIKFKDVSGTAGAFVVANGGTIYFNNILQGKIYMDNASSVVEANNVLAITKTSGSYTFGSLKVNNVLTQDERIVHKSGTLTFQGTIKSTYVAPGTEASIVADDNGVIKFNNCIVQCDASVVSSGAYTGTNVASASVYSNGVITNAQIDAGNYGSYHFAGSVMLPNSGNYGVISDQVITL